MTGKFNIPVVKTGYDEGMRIFFTSVNFTPIDLWWSRPTPLWFWL